VAGAYHLQVEREAPMTIALRGGLIMSLMLGMIACDRPVRAAEEFPQPEQDIPLTEEPEPRTAVLAAGCFWCVEAVFEELAGVHDVISGYAGGSAETATYEQVSTGRTGHAEVVQISYDASKISYGQLLRVFFFTHDPTTRDRQGPDRGSQYRSAIFYASEDEQRIAAAYIRQLDEAKLFSRPIVTTLEPLTEFLPAEQYHQDFVRENPQHPYVRQWALPKLEKVRAKFQTREDESREDRQ
jgi:peptide-methionine (S)-S-oxide reductase